MALEEEKCRLCGGKLRIKEKRMVGDTEYRILKCEKCNHQIAKQV